MPRLGDISVINRVIRRLEQVHEGQFFFTLLQISTGIQINRRYSRYLPLESLDIALQRARQAGVIRRRIDGLYGRVHANGVEDEMQIDEEAAENEHFHQNQDFDEPIQIDEVDSDQIDESEGESEDTDESEDTNSDHEDPEEEREQIMFRGNIFIFNNRISVTYNDSRSGNMNEDDDEDIE